MTIFRLLLGRGVLAPAELSARAQAQAAHQDQEPPLTFPTQVSWPHSPFPPRQDPFPRPHPHFPHQVCSALALISISDYLCRTPSPLALPLACHQPGSSHATQTFSPGCSHPNQSNHKKSFSRPKYVYTFKLLSFYDLRQVH